KLGKDTLVEVTEFTKPCAMIMGSFKDGDIMRISQVQHPGWSRVYAKVLSPGQVAIGDEVKIVS
ncbi:MAG: MOSC domain-containing protein, partial [Anaerolineaceae bacterium]